MKKYEVPETEIIVLSANEPFMGDVIATGGGYPIDPIGGGFKSRSYIMEEDDYE